ncbi:FMN-binding protein [Azonexus sp.]|uniref:FMN-binding protein n=1 Tax=Azonexus sp. TaxID=1872668 RepID=UPI0035AE1DC9
MNAISAPPPPPASPATPTAAMLRTLGLVSGICGLIIVGSYQGTFDAVSANKRLAVERSVFRVVPGATSIAAYDAGPGASIAPASGAQPAAGARRFFAAYDAAGKLAGIAAEGSAKGYADNVRVMFGYDPACECIRGFSVIAMRETPGIGDQVISNRQFLANFKALDARLDAGRTVLANRIITVRHGSKNQPWQIDAITGATITSRAVGKAIDSTAQALLPTLLPNLDQIGKPQ